MANNAEIVTALAECLLACVRSEVTHDGLVEAMSQVEEKVSSLMVQQVLTREGALWLCIASVAEDYRTQVLDLPVPVPTGNEAAVKAVYPAAMVVEEKGAPYGSAVFFTVVDDHLKNKLGPTAFTAENAWEYAAERIRKKKVVGQ